MPITEEQRIARRQWLGSSDMAAVLNVNPFCSSYDLFLEKTRQVEDVDAGEAADIGTRFEPAVMEWAEEQLGPISRDEFHALPEYHLGSHIDGVTQGFAVPVEAKTSGLRGPVWGEWGEEGTDHVPPWVTIQCHVHMLCLANEPRVCHVPAFLGGRGFLMYRIEKELRLSKAIIEGALCFWEDHVVKDIPPTDSEPSLAVVEHLKRVPKKTVSIPMSIMTRFEAAKWHETMIATELKEARVALLKHLGDAEAGDAGDAGSVTYFEQTRKGFDVDQLRKDDPALAAKYVTQSRHRRLLLKKPK